MIKYKLVPSDETDESFKYFCQVSFENAEQKRQFLMRAINQPAEWDTHISNWVTIPKSLEIEAFIRIEKSEAQQFLAELTRFIEGDLPELTFWEKCSNLFWKPLWWWKLRKLTDDNN